MTLDEYIKIITKEKFIIEELLVVGPYISHHFFTTNALRGRRNGRLPERRLTVIADRSWDDSQLEQINTHFEGARCKVKIFRATPGNTSGLVHAKIYYFSLRNADGTYRKKHLLIGSANASTQGFGTNAESYVSIDIGSLDDENRANAQKYLESLQNGNSASTLRLSVNRGIWLELPALQVTKRPSIDSFDTWLLRGRLCHQYQTDGNFGAVVLSLQSALPREDWIQLLTQAGLGEKNDLRTFVWRYAGLDRPIGDAEPRWKSAYFIDSNFGLWVSAECFSERNSHFRNPNFDERQRQLASIKQMTASDITLQAEQFVKIIQSSIKALLESKEYHSANVSKLFRYKNGELDKKNYLSRAEKKLRADKALAANSEFATRYISGYVFPRMPSLSNDMDDFAKSWCASLLLRVTRQRTVGRPAKALLAALQGTAKKEDLWHWSDDKLLYWLRENWETEEVRSRFLTYFNDEFA